MKIRKTIRFIGAALAGLAATSSHAVVEMYGTVMPFFENVHTTNATVGAPANRPNMIPASAYTGANDVGRNRMSAGTSNWGFRGDEELSPGLKAVWQLESGFQVDQNTGPGLGGRNSKVGLQCTAGEIFLGQWDTPYKFISLPINPMRAGYVFDYTPIMGNPGQGVPATTTQFTRIGAKPDAAFDKRAGNSIQYWSPRWGGLSFRVGHSTNEGKGPVVTGGPVIAPEIWSASTTWEEGGLSVRLGWEQHNDYFGMSQLGGSAAGTASNASSRDRAGKLVAIWRIGNTRVALALEQLQYRNNDSVAGAVNRYKRDSYYVLLEQRFGGSSLWFANGQARAGSCERVGGASCSTAGLNAIWWNVGYLYRFSRRTEFFATYYRLNNSGSASYSPQPTVGTILAPGADTTGIGAGITHYF
jgi:predicted porin